MGAVVCIMKKVGVGKWKIQPPHNFLIRVQAIFIMRRHVFAIFSVICLLASVFPLTFSQSSHRNATDKAVNYLVLNYNNSICLISETVNGSSFWLYSDNFLSATVLLCYEENNLTLTQTGNEISGKISYYLNECNIKPYSLYNVLGGGGFVAYNNSVIFTLEDGIKIDLNNGTSQLNPSEYGDIAFLTSLYYYKKGDLKRASDNFNAGALMCDGVGINDKAFREGGSAGIYQTYKLALFYLLGQVLGYNVPNSVVNRILSLQTSSGGFLTGYYPNGIIPEGVVTNTETTALVVYSLSPQIITRFFPKYVVYNQPPRVSSSSLSSIYAIIPLMVAVSIISIVIKKVKF